MSKSTTSVSNVSVVESGHFNYKKSDGTLASASFPLFLIRSAWSKECSFEDLADGFGIGCGTMGGDWSGIRDSSDEAIDAMLERAINHLGL